MLASKFCRPVFLCHTVPLVSINHFASSSKALNASPSESKSFCMNLFNERIVPDQVFPYPLKLNDDQHETLQMINGPVQKYLDEVNDAFKNDETSIIPMEQLKKFAELGVCGMVVPEEYEGSGLINSQMAYLAESIGKHDLSLGILLSAHQSIGYKGILLFGSEKLKKKYIPDLATGRKFAAFCLTEPSAGSDANSIRSRAQKSECGKYYILNGSKIWITNGGFADVLTVFAQTPVKQPDGSIKDQVSAFVVERKFGGVTSGAPEKKMGIKASNTTEVYFENVKIPVENLLGKEGEGFKVAMNILNSGRFGILALCTGSMKYSLQKTIDHVTSRVQFGKKIMEYGNVQKKVADMVQRIYVTESIAYMLSSNIDRNISDNQLEAAIGKVVATENAWYVCDEAIQLHGGMGFMRETGLERVLRDLRVFRIFEGENDIMRMFVASTGLRNAGKKQTGTSSDLSSIVHPSLRDSASLLSNNVSIFGKAIKSLLEKHRGNIAGRQYELIRIANAAIDIYSIACVLSRATRALDKNQEADDLEIAQLFTSTATKRIQQNLEEALKPDENDLKQIESIARKVYKANGLSYRHPIEL